MSMSINRRRFLQATSAVAVGAMAYHSGHAAAQSPGELRVALNGGDYAKACTEAFVKPFEAETGIKVTSVADEVTFTQLELMVSSGNVALDVIPTNPITAIEASQKGYLEEIDYSIYKKSELDAILDFVKQSHSVGTIVYAYCMFYNTSKLPTGQARPVSWSEFWDVAKYPGVRTLVSGQYGVEGPWEEALLADGVSPDAIYPMDIDRVFKSLDKIKPHIRKWFTSGSEIQQMMHDKVVDLGQTYDGRATLLIDQGDPIEINRNQAKLSWDCWAIPKGAANASNAQKFIEFITRADRLAAFSQLIPYGPANQNSFKLLPDALARKFATHPDHVKSSVATDPKWYAEVGSDGVSNAERLTKRWNEWVLQ
ncbi:extracellular solute-binding protein [Sinorhizobium meliloti]|uniref:ABC transporter substrate-binding protein n=1 Tax=Rhizobium meliloti TaxID=382 RepID=UPI00299D16F3|nr:extracellular solute-binding protein [Sinorhizobium meliloti]MDW9664724.1 extracellular solute-binding protein [Sinorhizobium meliloti]MDX0054546.1 extracellular solute-binding protein [Sinorhizobium meliloti]